MLRVPDYHVVRSCQTIDRTHERIAESMATLNVTAHLLLPLLRGGALREEPSPGDRTRVLIQAIMGAHGSKPTLWAGPGDGTKRCEGCGHDILAGACEYELVFDGPAGRSVVLDRDCFALWQSMTGL